MERLNSMLNEAAQLKKQNNRKALSSLLKEIIPERTLYFHLSRNLDRLDEYTDLLYRILCYELDESEEESIEIAELTYLGISEHIGHETTTDYELLRKRIILLHYFADYLTDSMIEIFLNKFRKNNPLEARNLALNSLLRMQAADFYLLEQNHRERVDQDETLLDACNNIPPEILPDMQGLEESILMHKVLRAFLKVKYNAGNLC